jgi:1,4-dihydroxy-6-naphthoate synthase
MATTDTRTVRIGHSPDPDDAFMYYAIANGKVDTAGNTVVQVLEDIESLNRRALAGELEVTAMSIHAYAHLADRYALMACGASMGDGYGPIVVAREPTAPRALADKMIAIPGTLTSAYLALRLFLEADFAFIVVPFDQIQEIVASGGADAGLIIHEGQLTYARHGLTKIGRSRCVVERAHRRTPPPARRQRRAERLGAAAMSALTRMYRESIAFALVASREALAYAKASDAVWTIERTIGSSGCTSTS